MVRQKHTVFLVLKCIALYNLKIDSVTPTERWLNLRCLWFNTCFSSSFPLLSQGNVDIKIQNLKIKIFVTFKNKSQHTLFQSKYRPNICSVFLTFIFIIYDENRKWENKNDKKDNFVSYGFLLSKNESRHCSNSWKIYDGLASYSYWCIRLTIIGIHT